MKFLWLLLLFILPLPAEEPMSKTAILGAMPQEIALIREQMQNPRIHQIGQLTFWEGTLHGHPVVLALSGIGKVAAATTTTLLLHTFHCDRLLFTGVAGSADPNIAIGDIVISSHLVQHDYDASPILLPLHVDRMTSDLLPAHGPWGHAALAAANACLARGVVQTDILAPFGITAPKAVLGVIASGDQFIHSADHLSTIRTRVLQGSAPSLACVEMEGAAVAQVCHLFDVPFLVIRTISDQADNNAHIDFIPFVDTVASRYSAALVHALLSN